MRGRERCRPLRMHGPAPSLRAKCARALPGCGPAPFWRIPPTVRGHSGNSPCFVPPALRYPHLHMVGPFARIIFAVVWPASSRAMASGLVPPCRAGARRVHGRRSNRCTRGICSHLQHPWRWSNGGPGAAPGQGEVAGADVAAGARGHRHLARRAQAGLRGARGRGHVRRWVGRGISGHERGACSRARRCVRAEHLRGWLVASRRVDAGGGEVEACRGG